MRGSDAVLDKDAILNMQIWYNPNFELPLRRDWLEKGIPMIVDLLAPMRTVLPIDDLPTLYSIKINVRL